MGDAEVDPFIARLHVEHHMLGSIGGREVYESLRELTRYEVKPGDSVSPRMAASMNADMDRVKRFFGW